MSNSKSALIVGLGGVTNGGKTTMCYELKRLFSSDKYNLQVLSIHLDHYYRAPDDPNHIYLDEYNHHDWDSLNALDINRFIEDIELNRSKCHILFIEGFLIYNIPSLLNTFNLIYYFDLPYEECLRRRLGRNYEPPDPQGYFEGHVWHAFVKAKKDALDLFNEKNMIIVDTMKESFEQIEQRIIKDIEIALSNKI